MSHVLLSICSVTPNLCSLMSPPHPAQGSGCGFLTRPVQRQPQGLGLMAGSWVGAGCEEPLQGLPPSQGCFKLSHRSMAQPAPSPAPNHQCGFLASHCPGLIPAATIGPHVSPLAEHHGAGDRGSVPAHVMALASPLPKTDCQRKKSPSNHKKLLRKEKEVIFQNTKSGFKTV